MSSKYPFRGTFIRSLIVAVCLGVIPVLATAAPVAASHNPSVVTTQDLQQAVAAKSATRDADRAAIRGLLERPQVQTIAARAGLDVNRAIARVNTLSGQDLSSLAARARTLNAQIAGGDDTIVLSTTGLLVIILVIVLLL